MRNTLIIPLFLAAFLSAKVDERVVAGFENGFEGWEASGEAFGTGPASGALPGQMEVRGFKGNGFVNSFHGGDDSTGKLVSPEFRIERPYLNFLIGGGGFPGETCMNLLVDGEIVRTATGPNTRPGGTEALEPEGWDVKEFAGKTARLEIVDSRKGGWGHITIDHIVQADTPAMFDARLEFTADKRYLVWPVDVSRSHPGRFFLRHAEDGKLLFFSDIRLSAEPEFRTFTDLADHQGQSFVLTARLPYESKQAWEMVHLSDTYDGEKELYREPLRPQYHFSSRRGWLNDPNGLVWHDGTWHLFYQHNPYNHGWHNMHWGHATSTDLFHWKEGPNALFPDDEGYMFSGSGLVVTKDRTSLPLNGESAIVLAYTAWGELSHLPGQTDTQALAWSPDGGKTFQKFEGNPVLPQEVRGNRDPKIFWHESISRWIMPLYLDGERYGIYISPDLVEWEKTGEYIISGDAECPDFFELPVNGDPGQTLWLAWGAHGKYLLGDFDGRVFKPQGEVLRHYFGSAYAGQSYDNAPDGRRVHIGWMRDTGAGLAGAPFNQQMTLPMDFTLRDNGNGPRLWIEPSPEIEALREDSREWTDLVFEQGGDDPLASFQGGQFEIEAVIDADSAASDFGFQIFEEHRAAWKKSDRTFTGAEGPQDVVDGKVRLRIFVDTVSLEVFVNGTYTSRYIRQGDGVAPVRLVAEGGPVKFDSLKIHRLRSVWK